MGTIVKICDGVYFDSNAELGAELISHQGRMLHRFMDKFYVRCPTEGLTPVEVSELCRARASQPSTILGANDAVRLIFKEFIQLRKPARILEIGAGNTPVLMANECKGRGIEYVAADADPSLGKGPLFSGMHPVLPHADDYFDTAIAVFVLHFHFYDAQIKELFRCLAPSGVLIANVYRRSPRSRNALLEAFETNGLTVQRLNDGNSLCSRHEYWIAGKNPSEVSAALDALVAICDSTR